MVVLDNTPFEQCEWCESTDTKWVEMDEPDPHYDFPDFDIKAGIVFVNLNRYCNKCECNYQVRIRFDIFDGRRVRW